MDVISQDQLPFSRIASELVGDDHGGLPVSLLFIDAPPGRGPGLIVQEGTVTFTAGDEERVVHAGEIVIVPPGTPHRFENTGDGPLRQLSIQMSPRFVTDWL